MFRGIQDVLHKVTHSDTPDPASPNELTRILEAEKLLADERRQELIKKFAKQISLSAENYQQLCEPLLKKFAEFAQRLPETRNSYFAHTGGLLDHALMRASTALALLRGYFLPEDASEDSPLTQPQTLWAYTIFTASILHDIGKIVVDFTVDIYDQNNRVVTTWSPFNGPMVNLGERYDYEFETNYPDNFKRRATMLLARQLMPAAGFQWIASQKDVLEVWLALLDDDERGAGTLGKVFWRADALVVERDLAKLRGKHFTSKDSSRFSQFQTNEETTGKEIKGDEVLGAKFLEWLKQNLEGQRILLNSSPAFVVPGGLLLQIDAVIGETNVIGKAGNKSDVFKQFASEAGTTATKAKAAFEALGITEKGTQTYLDTQTGKEVQGVVVKNTNLVTSDSALAKVVADNPSTLTQVATATVTEAQRISPNGAMVNANQGPKVTPSPVPTGFGAHGA